MSIHQELIGSCNRLLIEIQFWYSRTQYKVLDDKLDRQTRQNAPTGVSSTGSSVTSNDIAGSKLAPLPLDVREGPSPP